MFVKKTRLKTLVFGFLPIIAIFLCICFVMLFYDKATVYSVNTNNTYTAFEFLEQKKSEGEKFQNLYQIPQGEYTIKLHDDKIYVFDQNQDKIYLVKAKVSDFSTQDKRVLSKGINAMSQNELFELVEYMES